MAKQMRTVGIGQNARTEWVEVPDQVKNDKSETASIEKLRKQRDAMEAYILTGSPKSKNQGKYVAALRDAYTRASNAKTAEERRQIIAKAKKDLSEVTLPDAPEDFADYTLKAGNAGDLFEKMQQIEGAIHHMKKQTGDKSYRPSGLYSKQPLNNTAKQQNTANSSQNPSTQPLSTQGVNSSGSSGKVQPQANTVAKTSTSQTSTPLNQTEQKKNQATAQATTGMDHTETESGGEFVRNAYYDQTFGKLAQGADRIEKQKRISQQPPGPLATGYNPFASKDELEQQRAFKALGAPLDDKKKRELRQMDVNTKQIPSHVKQAILNDPTLDAKQRAKRLKILEYNLKSDNVTKRAYAYDVLKKYDTPEAKQLKDKHYQNRLQGYEALAVTQNSMMNGKDSKAYLEKLQQEIEDSSETDKQIATLSMAAIPQTFKYKNGILEVDPGELRAKRNTVMNLGLQQIYELTGDKNAVQRAKKYIEAGGESASGSGLEYLGTGILGAGKNLIRTFTGSSIVDPTTDKIIQAVAMETERLEMLEHLAKKGPINWTKLKQQATGDAMGSFVDGYIGDIVNSMVKPFMNDRHFDIGKSVKHIANNMGGDVKEIRSRDEIMEQKDELTSDISNLFRFGQTLEEWDIAMRQGAKQYDAAYGTHYADAMNKDKDSDIYYQASAIMTDLAGVYGMVKGFAFKGAHKATGTAFDGMRKMNKSFKAADVKMAEDVVDTLLKNANTSKIAGTIGKDRMKLLQQVIGKDIITSGGKVAKTAFGDLPETAARVYAGAYAANLFGANLVTNTESLHHSATNMAIMSLTADLLGKGFYGISKNLNLTGKMLKQATPETQHLLAPKIQAEANRAYIMGNIVGNAPQAYYNMLTGEYSEIYKHQGDFSWTAFMRDMMVGMALSGGDISRRGELGKQISDISGRQKALQYTTLPKQEIAQMPKAEGAKEFVSMEAPRVEYDQNTGEMVSELLSDGTVVPKFVKDKEGNVITDKLETPLVSHLSEAQSGIEILRNRAKVKPDEDLTVNQLIEHLEKDTDLMQGLSAKEKREVETIKQIFSKSGEVKITGGNLRSQGRWGEYNAADKTITIDNVRGTDHVDWNDSKQIFNFLAHEAGHDAVFQTYQKRKDFRASVDNIWNRVAEHVKSNQAIIEANPALVTSLQDMGIYIENGEIVTEHSPEAALEMVSMAMEMDGPINQLLKSISVANKANSQSLFSKIINPLKNSSNTVINDLYGVLISQGIQNTKDDVKLNDGDLNNQIDDIPETLGMNMQSMGLGLNTAKPTNKLSDKYEQFATARVEQGLPVPLLSDIIMDYAKQYNVKPSSVIDPEAIAVHMNNKNKDLEREKRKFDIQKDNIFRWIDNHKLQLDPEGEGPVFDAHSVTERITEMLDVSSYETGRVFLDHYKTLDKAGKTELIDEVVSRYPDASKLTEAQKTGLKTRLEIKFDDMLPVTNYTRFGDKIVSLQGKKRGFKNATQFTNVPSFVQAGQRKLYDKHLQERKTNSKFKERVDRYGLEGQELVNDLLQCKDIGLLDGDFVDGRYENAPAGHTLTPGNLQQLREIGFYLPKESGGWILKSELYNQISRDPKRSARAIADLHAYMIEETLSSGANWKYNGVDKIIRDKFKPYIASFASHILDGKSIDEWTFGNNKDVASKWVKDNADFLKEVENKIKSMYNIVSTKGKSTYNPFQTAKDMYAKKDYEELKKMLYESLYGAVTSLYNTAHTDKFPKSSKDGMLELFKITAKYQNLTWNSGKVKTKDAEQFGRLLPHLVNEDGKIDEAALARRNWVLKDGNISKKTVFIPHDLLKYMSPEQQKTFKFLNKNISDGITFTANDNAHNDKCMLLGLDPGSTVMTKSQVNSLDGDGNGLIHKSMEYYISSDDMSIVNPFVQVIRQLGRKLSDVGVETAVKNHSAYKPIEKEYNLTDDGEPVIVGVDQAGQLLYARKKGDDYGKNDAELFDTLMRDYAEKFTKGDIPSWAEVLVPLTGDGGANYIDYAHKYTDSKIKIGAGSIGLDSLPVLAYDSKFWEGDAGQRALQALQRTFSRLGDKWMSEAVKFDVASETFFKTQNNESGITAEMRQSTGEILQGIREKLNDDLFGNVQIPIPMAEKMIDAMLDDNGHFIGTKEQIDGLMYVMPVLVGVKNGKSWFDLQAEDMMSNAYQGRSTGMSLVYTPLLEGRSALQRGVRKMMNELKQNNENYKTNQNYIQGQIEHLLQYIDPENGEYTDNAPVVVVGKNDLQKLNTYLKKNGLDEVKIGDPVLCARIPTDGPASTLPLYLGGIVPGEGVVQIPGAMAAKAMGVDMDKDAITIRVPDDVFTKEDFKAVHEHFQKQGLTSGMYSKGIEHLQEMDKQNSGLSALAQEYGIPLDNRVSQPQSRGYYDTVLQSDGNIDIVIGATKAFTHAYSALKGQLQFHDGEPYKVKGDWNYTVEMLPDGQRISVKGTKPSMFGDVPFDVILDPHDKYITLNGETFHEGTALTSLFRQAAVDAWNHRTFHPLEGFMSCFVDGRVGKSSDPMQIQTVLKHLGGADIKSAVGNKDSNALARARNMMEKVSPKPNNVEQPVKQSTKYPNMVEYKQFEFNRPSRAEGTDADRAMREVADGFIGEITGHSRMSGGPNGTGQGWFFPENEQTSTSTSYKSIIKKNKSKDVGGMWDKLSATDKLYLSDKNKSIDMAYVDEADGSYKAKDKDGELKKEKRVKRTFIANEPVFAEIPINEKRIAEYEAAIEDIRTHPDKYGGEGSYDYVTNIMDLEEYIAEEKDPENRRGYENASVVMLARNQHSGQKLNYETKKAIETAHKLGSTFVVGDMPGVDTPFIDYLESIGAKYTVYGHGRLDTQPTQPTEQTEQDKVKIYNESSQLQKIGSAKQYSQYFDTIFPDSKSRTIVHHGSLNGIQNDKFDKQFLGSNTGSPSAKLGFFFTNSKELAEYYSGKETLSFNIHTKETPLELPLQEEGSFSLEDMRIKYKIRGNEVFVEEIYHADDVNTVRMSLNEFKQQYGKYIVYQEEVKSKEHLINSLEGHEAVKEYPVLLNQSNPLVIDDKGIRGFSRADENKQTPESYRERLVRAQKEGYDSVIIKNTLDPYLADIYVVFEPEQIYMLGTAQDAEKFKEFVTEQVEQGFPYADPRLEFPPYSLWDHGNQALINKLSPNMVQPSIDKVEIAKNIIESISANKLDIAKEYYEPEDISTITNTMSNILDKGGAQNITISREIANWAFTENSISKPMYGRYLHLLFNAGSPVVDSQGMSSSTYIKDKNGKAIIFPDGNYRKVRINQGNFEIVNYSKGQNGDVIDSKPLGIIFDKDGNYTYNNMPVHTFIELTKDMVFNYGQGIPFTSIQQVVAISLIEEMKREGVPQSDMGMMFTELLSMSPGDKTRSAPLSRHKIDENGKVVLMSNLLHYDQVARSKGVVPMVNDDTSLAETVVDTFASDNIQIDNRLGMSISTIHRKMGFKDHGAAPELHNSIKSFIKRRGEEFGLNPSIPLHRYTKEQYGALYEHIIKPYAEKAIEKVKKQDNDYSTHSIETINQLMQLVSPDLIEQQEMDYRNKFGVMGSIGYRMALLAEYAQGVNDAMLKPRYSEKFLGVDKGWFTMINKFASIALPEVYSRLTNKMQIYTGNEELTVTHKFVNGQVLAETGTMYPTAKEDDTERSVMTVDDLISTSTMVSSIIKSLPKHIVNASPLIRMNFTKDSGFAHVSSMLKQYQGTGLNTDEDIALACDQITGLTAQDIEAINSITQVNVKYNGETIEQVSVGMNLDLVDLKTVKSEPYNQAVTKWTKHINELRAANGETTPLSADAVRSYLSMKALTYGLANHYGNLAAQITHYKDTFIKDKNRRALLDQAIAKAEKARAKYARSDIKDIVNMAGGFGKRRAKAMQHFSDMIDDILTDQETVQSKRYGTYNKFKEGKYANMNILLPSKKGKIPEGEERKMDEVNIFDYVRSQINMILMSESAFQDDANADQQSLILQQLRKKMQYQFTKLAKSEKNPLLNKKEFIDTVINDVIEYTKVSNDAAYIYDKLGELGFKQFQTPFTTLDGKSKRAAMDEAYMILNKVKKSIVNRENKTPTVQFIAELANPDKMVDYDRYTDLDSSENVSIVDLYTALVPTAYSDLEYNAKNIRSSVRNEFTAIMMDVENVAKQQYMDDPDDNLHARANMTKLLSGINPGKKVVSTRHTNEDMLKSHRNGQEAIKAGKSVIIYFSDEQGRRRAVNGVWLYSQDGMFSEQLKEDSNELQDAVVKPIAWIAAPHRSTVYAVDMNNIHEVLEMGSYNQKKFDLQYEQEYQNNIQELKDMTSNALSGRYKDVMVPTKLVSDEVNEQGYVVSGQTEDGLVSERRYKANVNDNIVKAVMAYDYNARYSNAAKIDRFKADLVQGIIANTYLGAGHLASIAAVTAGMIISPALAAGGVALILGSASKYLLRPLNTWVGRNFFGTGASSMVDTPYASKSDSKLIKLPIIRHFAQALSNSIEIFSQNTEVGKVLNRALEESSEDNAFLQTELHNTIKDQIQPSLMEMYFSGKDLEEKFPEIYGFQNKVNNHTKSIVDRLADMVGANLLRKKLRDKHSNFSSSINKDVLHNGLNKVKSDIFAEEPTVADVNGYTLQEIEDMQFRLSTWIMHKLSWNGMAQRMEGGSLEKAYAVAETNVQHLNDMTKQMNRKVHKHLIKTSKQRDLTPEEQAMLNEIEDGGSPDVSDFYRFNLLNQRVKKSIGDYRKNAARSSTFANLMTMYSDFTKESFLNQTAYAMKRNDIYNFMHEELMKDEVYRDIWQSYGFDPRLIKYGSSDLQKTDIAGNFAAGALKHFALKGVPAALVGLFIEEEWLLEPIRAWNASSREMDDFIVQDAVSGLDFAAQALAVLENITSLFMLDKDLPSTQERSATDRQIRLVRDMSGSSGFGYQTLEQTLFPFVLRLSEEIREGDVKKGVRYHERMQPLKALTPGLNLETKGVKKALDKKRLAEKDFIR